MNKTIKQTKQFILKSLDRFNSKSVKTPLLLALAIAVILSVNLVSVYAKSDYKTTINFDKNQMQPLVLSNRQVEIEPGLAKIDVDKLNIERDPEAIKAYIQQLGSEYGVDWKLIYAIGTYESGYFKSSLACSNNNFFGRKATSTTWRSYSTPEEGIRDQFDYVKEHYIDNGLDTPEKMNHIYCEGTTWQYKVRFIMNTI